MFSNLFSYNRKKNKTFIQNVIHNKCFINTRYHALIHSINTCLNIFLVLSRYVLYSTGKLRRHLESNIVDQVGHKSYGKKGGQQKAKMR